MKYVNTSRKGFTTLTLLTIVSIALVVVAYAAVTIGTFTGGEVTVLGTATGNVRYSTTNEEGASWTVDLTPGSSSWYTRLEIGADTYTGPVTVTWQLQNKTGPSTWENFGAATSTAITLTGAAQNVYVTSDGLITGNRDWKLTATETGTYRVVATVASV